MIKGFEFYHGSVFSKIVNDCDAEFSLKRFDKNSNSSYVINTEIGIYIKYSTKRLSPWRFTFLEEQQKEMEKMKKSLKKTFLILVCHDDGIVCLSYSELKKVLDDSHDSMEWISVKRSKREMFSLKGSDGKLDFKVGRNEFPAKIFNREIL